ncbi:MAG: hypothetical protein NW226_16905 [Microscillaceae bacterium]|nr:hypothetical protein [Microscillaceae bacterium]
MKKSIFLSLFIICITCVVMAQENASSDMIKLSPLSKKSVSVQVGQKLYFEAKVHGSVGMSAQFSISNEKTIRLVSEDLEFKNPQQADMPGGDSAVRTYIFEAIQPGTSQIKIEQVFRGKVEDSYTFKIKVNE